MSLGLGLELAGAYLAGLVTLPLSAACWWRLCGKRWLARRMLGQALGGLANITTNATTTSSGGSEMPGPPKP